MIKIIKSPEALCRECEKGNIPVFRIPTSSYDAYLYFCLKCLQQAFFAFAKAKKGGQNA